VVSTNAGSSADKKPSLGFRYARSTCQYAEYVHAICTKPCWTQKMETTGSSEGQAMAALQSIANLQSLLHIKTPQLIGILAGCVVFTITIGVVIYLLIASGTLQRAMTEISTGKPVETKADTQKKEVSEQVPELYEHLLKAAATLPSVPDVPPLTSKRISIGPLQETDAFQLVLASNGSPIFGESSYDPLRVWRWLADANMAAQKHEVSFPSQSEGSFLTVFTPPKPEDNFVHLTISDVIIKKPVGMLSIVNNCPANLSARLGIK
jgi:hypothetical protein